MNWRCTKQLAIDCKYCFWFLEYAQNNYNGNSGRTQASTAYRGTPAPSPVVQATSVREEVPKRGNAVYLQNNYNQDIYQQSTVADYNEDNRYDSQASKKVAFQFLYSNS